MDAYKKTNNQIWIIAAGINLVIFLLLWLAFLRIPAPSKPSKPEKPSNITPIGSVNPSLGNSFGQNPNIADTSSVPSIEGSIFPDKNLTDLNTSSKSPDTWVNEFYLDKTPVLSFAPRLNPDGSPKSLQSDSSYSKAPSFEDQDTILTSENTNPPSMNPPFLSKKDLPKELRDFNYNLTVRINLDARGRVLGKPIIIKSSGNPTIDQLTIDKIMTEVKFSPATAKETGKPVPTQWDLPIFWD